MKRFAVIYFMCLISIPGISQNADLSKYSYVVVPDIFDFLSTPNQFELNSMTIFYLEKSGFNTYLSSQIPNANRCDGLYANVEKISTILATRLQVVLRDCDNQIVYESELGKSKYKDYSKAYQDALRKAFKSMEGLRVKPKELVLLKDSSAVSGEEKKSKSEEISTMKPAVSSVSGVILPTSKFSSYSKNGKSFLLRKSAEGYSLYEENINSEDGLQLMGKIVVMEKVVKYMDTSGNVSDAAFDASGNLTIKDATSTTVYQLIN